MKSLSQFDELYSSKSTCKAYKSGVYAFLEYVYVYQVKCKGDKITNEEKKDFDNLVILYFSEKRDYTEDIIKFAVSVSNKPPMTVKTYIVAGSLRTN
jgi:hypothetical protein